MPRLPRAVFNAAAPLSSIAVAPSAAHFPPFYRVHGSRPHYLCFHLFTSGSTLIFGPYINIFKIHLLYLNCQA